VNRASRRKQVTKNKKRINSRSKQLLSLEATGLTLFQLNQLLQMKDQAQQAFDEEKYELAEALSRKCIDLYPIYTTALTMLGKIAIRQDKYELAATFYEKSLSILPDVHERQTAYAFVLTHLNRHEEAVEALKCSVRLNPSSSANTNDLANALNTVGRQREAVLIFEKLIKSDPLFGEPFRSLAMQHKFTEGDRYSEYYQKLALDINKMTRVLDIKAAHFALGKYNEDLKDFEKGFFHFFEANKIIRQDRQYDIDAEVEVVNSLKKHFPKNGRWVSNNTNGSSSNVPIFIVGMPRSGTTLTEQVLSSHPEIFGAGELLNFSSSTRNFSPFWKNDTELLPEEPVEAEKINDLLAATGQKIVEEITSLSPKSKHIVDKMPLNFLSIGLIHMMLPKAKIIHCKRDPIDTCLSNFRLPYEQENLYFTADLMCLGKYYVAYAELMAHWNEILPGKILEVNYEDTVDDLETQARRIIDFVGVEWDDACLDFYKTKRSVNTASVSQVRQPIYKTSVGRHERYGDLLKPLLDALEPVLSK